MMVRTVLLPLLFQFHLLCIDRIHSASPTSVNASITLDSPVQSAPHSHVQEVTASSTHHVVDNTAPAKEGDAIIVIALNLEMICFLSGFLLLLFVLFCVACCICRQYHQNSNNMSATDKRNQHQQIEQSATKSTATATQHRASVDPWCTHTVAVTQSSQEHGQGSTDRSRSASNMSNMNHLRISLHLPPMPEYLRPATIDIAGMSRNASYPSPRHQHARTFTTTPVSVSQLSAPSPVRAKSMTVASVTGSNHLTMHAQPRAARSFSLSQANGTIQEAKMEGGSQLIAVGNLAVPLNVELVSEIISCEVEKRAFHLIKYSLADEDIKMTLPTTPPIDSEKDEEAEQQYECKMDHNKNEFVSFDVYMDDDDDAGKISFEEEAERDDDELYLATGPSKSPYDDVTPGASPANSGKMTDHIE